MTALKTLIEQRNQLVHDARELLAESTPEKEQQADGLLDEAAKLDSQIQDAQKSVERERRLSDLEGRISQTVPRQTSSAIPGQAPRGGDGASLTLSFGRNQLRLSPGDKLYGRTTDTYGDAFRSYLTGGGASHDLLAQQVGSDPKGGYLAPMGFISELIKAIDDAVYMRQISKVLPPTTAKSVGAVSFNQDPQSPEWTPEIPASALTPGTGMRFGARELAPHMLARLVKSSEKMLRTDTRGFSVQAYLIERLSYVFGIVLENAYLTGDGAQKPLGVFTPSDYGVPTSRDVTASSATDFKADDVLDLIHKLKVGYRNNSVIYTSPEFIKRCRKLKDGNGQYLLWDSRNPTELSQILNRPYVESEFCPATFTAGLYIAVIGDWNYYWVQDGLGFTVQFLDQLFALTNEVGWIGRLESDAMPVLGEAFARLKLA